MYWMLKFSFISLKRAIRARDPIKIPFWNGSKFLWVSDLILDTAWHIFSRADFCSSKCTPKAHFNLLRSNCCREFITSNHEFTVSIQSACLVFSGCRHRRAVATEWDRSCAAGRTHCRAFPWQSRCSKDTLGQSFSSPQSSWRTCSMSVFFKKQPSPKWYPSSRRWFLHNFSMCGASGKM